MKKECKQHFETEAVIEVTCEQQKYCCEDSDGHFCSRDHAFQISVRCKKCLKTLYQEQVSSIVVNK